MVQATEIRSPGPARILLFSQRNIYKPDVWRAGSREFEAIIQEVDEVDVLAPGRGRWFEQRRNYAQRVWKYSHFILNPGIQRTRLNKYYDLMFVICEGPLEVLHVNAIKGWKDYCKTSICLLTEFYQKNIPIYKSSLEVLAKFDHVLFTTVGIDAFRARLPGSVAYIPPGVDSVRFCPYPAAPKRSIDVLSIGRRSEETHRALLKMAHNNEIFYVYDTIKSLVPIDIEDHRFLLANNAKRSQYFIVNPGKIDSPEETGGQNEFGPRFCEGASAGAIMIGERPKNKEFDRVFHWPDAVINVPFGAEDIGEVIRDLNKDPDRQTTIRRNNITQSLLSFDWAYRWESVLRLSGLQPKPKLLERKQLLESLAKQAAKV